MKPILGFNGGKFVDSVILIFLFFYMLTGIITYYINKNPELYHMSIFLSFVHLFFISKFLYKVE